MRPANTSVVCSESSSFRHLVSNSVAQEQRVRQPPADAERSVRLPRRAVRLEVHEAAVRKACRQLERVEAVRRADLEKREALRSRREKRRVVVRAEEPWQNRRVQDAAWRER